MKQSDPSYSLEEVGRLLGLSADEVVSGVASDRLPDPEDSEPEPAAWRFDSGKVKEFQRAERTLSAAEAAQACGADPDEFELYEKKGFMQIPAPSSVAVPADQRRYPAKALKEWERRTLEITGNLLKVWFEIR